jgi:hypothetical protein
MIEAIWKAKFQKVEHPKRFAVEKNELVEVHPGQSTEAHNPAYTVLGPLGSSSYKLLSYFTGGLSK